MSDDKNRRILQFGSQRGCQDNLFGHSLVLGLQSNYDNTTGDLFVFEVGRDMTRPDIDSDPDILINMATENDKKPESFWVWE